jgi:SynChlorMet cassette protein ScmC
VYSRGVSNCRHFRTVRNWTVMYPFRLSDGQYWGIEPSGDTREWADEFAFLLGLKPLQGCPDRTIRIRRVPLPSEAGTGRPSSSSQGYPKEGWRGRISHSLEDWRHPAVLDVVFRLHQTESPRRVKEQMRHALLPVYESAVSGGGFPIHCALVEHEGRGLLLVGKSGAGKSTACLRLPPGWNALADDMVLSLRAPGGGFRVHPLPTWSAVEPGSRTRSWDIGQNVPLSAIFFLSQAADDAVIPAGRAMASVILAEAAMTIFNSVNSGSRAFETSPLKGDIFANAAAMVNAVPSYILRLTLGGRFWEKLEEALERSDDDCDQRTAAGQRA